MHTISSTRIVEIHKFSNPSICRHFVFSNTYIFRASELLHPGATVTIDYYNSYKPLTTVNLTFTECDLCYDNLV